MNNYAKCALWAKHTVPVIQACKTYGKPENLTLIYSSPIIGLIPRLPEYFDYVFVVFPDKETTKAAIENGACECNGKKCRECGYKCYKHEWANGSVIAELLKGVNANERKTIINYLREKGIL